MTKTTKTAPEAVSFREIDTLEKALEVLGETFTPPTGVPDWVVAAMELETIIRAINGTDWEADYSNPNQLKYYLYFYGYKAGVGFSGFDYADAHSSTVVGARLSFQSAEKARHVGEKFLSTFNRFLLKNI